MARLTDAQLIILSAASQRDDRGVELPANVKGEAARKVVDKLIRAGLLEEEAAVIALSETNGVSIAAIPRRGGANPQNSAHLTRGHRRIRT
jgi:hypothetical protein